MIIDQVTNIQGRIVGLLGLVLFNVVSLDFIQKALFIFILMFFLIYKVFNTAAPLTY